MQLTKCRSQAGGVHNDSSPWLATATMSGCSFGSHSLSRSICGIVIRQPSPCGRRVVRKTMTAFQAALSLVCASTQILASVSAPSGGEELSCTASRIDVGYTPQASSCIRRGSITLVTIDNGKITAAPSPNSILLSFHPGMRASGICGR